MYQDQLPIKITIMSGATALFGNTAGRNQSKNLVEFKAGKMSMRGKMVYPDKRKGLLYIHQSDDSLIHFCWKDRSSGVVEDVSGMRLLYLFFNSTKSLHGTNIFVSIYY